MQHPRKIKGIAVLLILCWLPFATAAASGVQQEPDKAAGTNLPPLVSRALPMDFSGGAALDPNGYYGGDSYADPTVRVSVKSGRADECDYWVADIQIGHPSQLRTAAADAFSTNMALPGATIARRVNAAFALNGDYYSFTRKGFIVRQGVAYKDILEGRRDLLLIDENGDFHFVRNARKGEGLLEVGGKKIVNAFFFGPILVENGAMVEHFSFDEMTLSERCQRICIAQAGPLHYQVACCAGPYRGSTGMTMKEFAKLVYGLGLNNAYNLDGGNSAMMIFNGKKINDPENPKTRDIVDILYFASSAGIE